MKNLVITKKHVTILNIVLKIGNEGQKSCIDPIQEVDSFEVENESFLHENNYLFHNLTNEEITNSFEINSTLPPSDFCVKFDSTIEESEIRKIRNNILSLKANKSQDPNKSEIITEKKRVFQVHNLTNNNISNNNNNSINKLNQSCSLSIIYPNDKRRGRKKLLFDGIKTEIIDKAFLREFKSYLKRTKCLKYLYEELKPEEKGFWNDFMQTNNPPFTFLINNTRIEFKSYSKNFLKHIFSFASVRQLYNQFFRERGKEIINSIVNKKKEKVDRKLILFYSFYGKNMHKLYSNEILNDMNIDDISENLVSTSAMMSTYDSMNCSL
jgi:hypothetical protein